MYHLRVPVFLLTAFVLLRCITAGPSHRYFSPASSDNEQENALPDKESRSLPDQISKPFLGLKRVRPQRGLTATNRRHLQKLTCNLPSCSTLRLANTLGKFGKKGENTDVGKNSFGKRDIHQPPAQLP